MIVPSKFIPLKSSILAKLPDLCSKKGKHSIFDLYSSHTSNFNGIDEFIYALDVLFILNRIEIDFATGVVNVS